MPAGVAVVVENGFATIDFVDSSKRGPGLQALLDVGTPPELIEKLTRSGPRVRYVVPEGNAREAGLLDEVSEVDALEQPDTTSARDAIGAVPPEFPSTRDLHAQVLRSGSYSHEYAVGGLVEAAGTGVANEGVVAQSGETVELVGTDTGGPYTVLPELPDASYGPGSTPLEPLTSASEPTGDAQGSQAEQASEPLDAIIGTADATDAASAGDAELIEIPGGGTVESATQAWPDGEPELEWKRPELDAYAASKGIDTRELPNKRDVLAAITKAAER
ncbi:hypothetical protein ABQF35_14280 [Mycobacterium syngnathidarum]